MSAQSDIKIVVCWTTGATVMLSCPYLTALTHLPLINSHWIFLLVLWKLRRTNIHAGRLLVVSWLLSCWLFALGISLTLAKMLKPTARTCNDIIMRDSSSGLKWLFQVSIKSFSLVCCVRTGNLAEMSVCYFHFHLHKSNLQLAQTIIEMSCSALESN